MHQMQLAKIDDVERVSKVASQISKRFISNYKSVGDEPPSPLQCAAARPPMMVLLLGAIIEAPHEASLQLARASEVTWKWSVFSLLLVFRHRLAVPARLSPTEFYNTLDPGHSLRMHHDQRVRWVQCAISSRVPLRPSPSPT